MQVNEDSSPPQPQLTPTSPSQTHIAATTQGGNSTSRVTRSALINKQSGQNKGGTAAVSYVTTKTLRESAAKKRARKNQRDDNAQVIFLTPLCVN